MSSAKNRLTFKATMAQVSVPATSANLGPGFDSLGLALELRDRYAAQILDDATFDVDVSGEGSAEVKTDKNNLVIKAMLHGFEHMGQKPKGIALRQLNVIPHGRGLGSSAAAIVGGLALARALVLGGDQLLTDEEMISLGTQLEGHPDNIAAAVLGGATIAWTTVANDSTENSGHGVAISVDPKIKALVFIPEAHLATSKARKLLPETIPHQDAVLNASRAALLVHAIQSRPDLLLEATEDLLHQNYRAEAMPKSMALVNKLRAAGVPAMISGAGPSVLVLHTLDDLEVEAVIKVGAGSFAAQKLAISTHGVE
ncbi:MAG: homoserine kinase [Actinobacteria bacterium]|uniref:Homoserine kinase n=1 Tax=freshwater metagenome TaxID=449393 RepID=A0A6J6SNM7_9ZZZZ|nr:homoserine kinase [Actinomycetota bacterium]